MVSPPRVVLGEAVDSDCRRASFSGISTSLLDAMLFEVPVVAAGGAATALAFCGF